jgi:hypothetical protein
MDATQQQKNALGHSHNMICTVDHVADGAVQIRSGILRLFVKKLLCIFDDRTIDVLAIILS